MAGNAKPRLAIECWENAVASLATDKSSDRIARTFECTRLYVDAAEARLGMFAGNSNPAAAREMRNRLARAYGVLAGLLVDCKRPVAATHYAHRAIALVRYLRGPTSIHLPVVVPAPPPNWRSCRPGFLFFFFDSR
jgi:hypothetical protein